MDFQEVDFNVWSPVQSKLEISTHSFIKAVSITETSWFHHNQIRMTSTSNAGKNVQLPLNNFMLKTFHTRAPTWLMQALYLSASSQLALDRESWRPVAPRGFSVRCTTDGAISAVSNEARHAVTAMPRTRPRGAPPHAHLAWQDRYQNR